MLGPFSYNLFLIDSFFSCLIVKLKLTLPWGILAKWALNSVYFTLIWRPQQMRKKGDRKWMTSQMYSKKNNWSKVGKDEIYGLAGLWSSLPQWVHLLVASDLWKSSSTWQVFSVFACVCVRVTLKLVQSNLCVCSTSRVSLMCSRSNLNWRWLSCHRKSSLWLEREYSQGSAWICPQTCVCDNLHCYTKFTKFSQI